MAITSFSTLKNAVADWLDRDDIDSAITTMVALMETRLYRDLRLRFMETDLNVSVASGVAAVPSDYLELRTAYLDTTPIQELQPKTPGWIQSVYPTRSADGTPKYIARSGDNFIFGPYPDSDRTLMGVYYAKPTALSTSNETNWLTTNAPDLLLYGTLVQSAAYIGSDDRLGLWESAYSDAFNMLEAQEQREQFPENLPLTMTVL